MAIELGTSCDECDHYIAADEMRVCKACYEGALEAARMRGGLFSSAAQRMVELYGERDAIRERIGELKMERDAARERIVELKAELAKFKEVGEGNVLVTRPSEDNSFDGHRETTTLYRKEEGE